jgi:hypothetical protein
MKRALAALLFGLVACTEVPVEPVYSDTAVPSFSVHHDDGTVSYLFSFNATGFAFDFGNKATVQIGTFTYDSEDPVDFYNGQGFYVTHLDFGGLSLDPQLDHAWVPQPTSDDSTIGIGPGEVNDQWFLVESGGNYVFDLSGYPNGVGGFVGRIAESGTFAEAIVTYTLVEDGRVPICHKPGEASEHALVISVKGVAGHLLHGDTIGPCQ